MPAIMLACCSQPLRTDHPSHQLHHPAMPLPTVPIINSHFVLLMTTDGSFDLSHLSAFGELALLFPEPRAATVRATAPCRLWVMQRTVFNAVKRNFMQAQNAERHRLLEAVPSLKHLSPHHRALLVDALKQVGKHRGRQIW